MKVCLDSRLIKKGDYFVAVAGENTDGHKFIDQAIKNGAKGVLEVEDLFNIAKLKLKKIKPVVIAITGSVGKSTTREYLSQALSSKYHVCQGTLNTKIGLAVNIINDLKPKDKFFVAECGMDRMGELKETGEFLEPNIVVLTNISESHALKLKSLKNIKKAKAELLQTLKKGGTAYLNWNCKNVRDVAGFVSRGVKKVRYGLKNIIPAKLLPNFIEDHNLQNLNVCYLICQKFKVPVSFKGIKTPKGRMNKLKGINNCAVIDDTYNSSPVSCTSALQAGAKYFNKGRKIAVLGGMLELGYFEDKGHIIVGDNVAKYKYDILIVVGDLAKKILKSKMLKKVKIYEVENSEEAGDLIIEKIRPDKNDLILVKGSQGIRMEKCVEKILKNKKLASKLLVRQDARWK